MPRRELCEGNCRFVSRPKPSSIRIGATHVWLVAGEGQKHQNGESGHGEGKEKKSDQGKDSDDGGGGTSTRDQGSNVKDVP